MTPLPELAGKHTASRHARGNRGRVSIFVLIDALGWSYLQGRGFLDDLLPYRKPLRTVLGFSSGAIPSILTGLPPARTGHWNLLYYDPKHSPFRWLRHFGFLPDNRITRRAIRELGRRVLGLGPLFECCVSPRLLPWFNWAEKKNIYSRGGITGAPSIFDTLAGAGVKHKVYSYHRGSDAAILEQAHRDIAHAESDFSFLYLSEMDGFLHMNCHDNAAIEDKLSFYEDGLRRIVEAARARDAQAQFVVFSDHGMTPVRQTCDLPTDIAALPLRMPADYLAVYDSTMARFWFFSDRAWNMIVPVLEASRQGRILPPEELWRLGVLFEDHRYGELVFLLNAGCMFGSSDFNGPRWKPAGMHGYHPDDSYSDACFLSNREPSAPVLTITDIHRCMLEAVNRT